VSVVPVKVRSRKEIRNLVAGMAWWRETKTMEPIDKAF